MASKLFLSIVLLFILVNFPFCSVGASLEMWSQTYGGTDHESAHSVVATSDGGYAIAGLTDSVGDVWGEYGVLLVKTDSSGNMEWNRTYGKFYSNQLVGMPIHSCSCSLVATSDGGYAIAGDTYSLGAGGYNSWLIKTDASGNVEWNRTYPGSGVHSLAVAYDGGYALAGSRYPVSDADDFWLIKTDEFGDVEWTRAYGGAENDVARSLVETSDGGYALAGQTYSFGAGGYDCWLVKTDASGNMEWNQTYGGPNYDMAISLVVANDGGYTLVGNTGHTDSFGGSYNDFWLVKTDEYGNMEWNRTYGGSDWEWAYCLVKTSDGGYAIAGHTDPIGPFEDRARQNDFWLVKTDASGNMEWNQTYGGTAEDMANSLVATSDGGYAIAGSTRSFGAGGYDFWVIKTDEYGIVPEYSSWVLLSIMLVATFVIVIYKKKFFDDHP